MSQRKPPIPGRERVCCPKCDRLVLITSEDFRGSVSGFCRICKIQVPAHLLTTDTVPEVRLSCQCGRWIANGIIKQGWVQAHCRQDRALVRLEPSRAIVIEPTREVPTSKRARRLRRDEQMIELLEERWEAMRADRFRKRAEIAVGLRFDVFSRDGFRCRYCGRGPENGVTLEADHVLARANGGADTLDNLVTACWDCNRGKSAKRINALDAA